MNYSKKDHKIAQILKRTCDVSLRDGMQCLYNNSWYIEDLVFIAKTLNEISRIILALTGEPLTIEAAGGDTFNAAIRLKGEDPFENIKKLKNAMPDCRIRSLTRGRQLLGFSPVSGKVIAKAVQESAKNGVGLFRVFDMLNQVDNLAPSIKAIINYRNRQMDTGIPTDKALALELCICYISEPAESTPVVSIADYVHMGQVFMHEANKYMRKSDPAVNNGLRAALQEMKTANKLSYTPNIILHSHGDKAEQLKQALEEGADYVDTAIGNLSGGVSHTNIFDYLWAWGISKHDVNGKKSVLLHKLKEVEDLIQILSKKYEDYRTPDVPIEDIYHSRLAGGAVSAVQNTLKKQRSNFEIFWKKNGVPDTQFLSEQATFDQVLLILSEIWDRSGRENTVTPGSRIFSDMAILAIMHGRKMTVDGKIIQDIFPPYEYIPVAYKNLIMGRLGDNTKAVEIIGDPQVLLLRKAFLIEDTLKKVATLALESPERMMLHAGELIGKDDDAFTTHDLRKIDFVKLAKQGALEALKKVMSKVAKSNPSSIIEKLQARAHLGKLSEDTVLMRVVRQYAEELKTDGLISDDKLDRAALLKAMSDPNQPNQVRHLYEYQRTGKPPMGSTILDMRGYVAKLKEIEIVVPDDHVDNALKIQTLGELASQLAAIEMRLHDPKSPHRYALFIIKAMEVAEHTLKRAGFKETLNGTGMGMQEGMRIFRELVEENKKEC